MITHDQELGRHVPGIADAPEVELPPIPDDDLIENEDGSVTVTSLKPQDKKSSEKFDENLAEVFEKSYLKQLALDLIEDVERDKDARKKRDKQYAEGLERSGLSGDAPGGATFEGSSHVVHPVLAEATVDFQAMAIKELFPPDGPVKTKLRGDVSPLKQQVADRKKNYLNWQLTKKIEEYFDELEQTLSQLPMGGSQYQKWHYDPRLKRPVIDFVPIDEVYLPFSAPSFYTASRLTHRQLLTRSEFEARVRSGLYVYELEEGEGAKTNDEAPDRSESQKANDEIEGKEEENYNEDGLREVFEIYTWESPDDPMGSEEDPAPYIITIDANTEQIIGYYRNWKEGDESFTKLDWWVDWGFIPWRGVYKLGLYHLIGTLAISATGALRALLDSAHINNAPTLLKLKSGRISGQTTGIEITQIQEIEGPAGVTDVRQLAMPVPFNPPSAILYELLGWLTNAAKGVVTTAEEKIADASNNMPVGTTLALIEQGSKVMSAVHMRLHRSQAKSLEILCRINHTWFDAEEARRVFGDDAPTQEDFANNDDIQPVSDPNIFSDAQRMARWQGLIQMSQDPRVQWNVHELYQEGLRLMKVDDVEKYLPRQPQPEMLEPTDENIAATLGKPLKVFPTQDDLMHMASHLKFATSQLVQVAGLVSPTVPVLLGHVKEHLMQYYKEHAAVASQTAEALGQARGAEAQTRTFDLTMATMGEELAPLLPLFEQAMQLAAQAAQQQQPPMDPQSQVALKLGEAEIQRKQAYDQQVMQLKQVEIQAAQERDSIKLQQEQQAQQFEQMLKAQAQQAEERAKELAQQIELMKNDQDNKYNQITELIKNKDDNDTAIIVEQMKQQLNTIQASVDQATQGRTKQEEAIDTAPIMQQLQETLKSSQQAAAQNDHHEAIRGILTGIQGIHEHLARPKRIVRDQNGDALGIE